MTTVDLAPGVVVQEAPPRSFVDSGRSATAAAFLGVTPDEIVLPTGRPVVGEVVEPGTWNQRNFPLDRSPVVTEPRTFDTRVGGVSVAAELVNNDPDGSQVIFETAPGTGATIEIDYLTTGWHLPPSGEVRLVTHFSAFSAAFGEISADRRQNRLAHAVRGFFANGGQRCFVVRVSAGRELAAALATLAGIDEIAVVAAPGLTGPGRHRALIGHCERAGDRFAVLDGSADGTPVDGVGPSPHAAAYVPWIEVFDPPSGTFKAVAPSGHVAGVYARTDAERGPHAVPANAVVRGARAPARRFTPAERQAWHEAGVNVIREISGAPVVWGARTLGGAANGPWRFVHTRRFVLALRREIERRIRWTVGQPHESGLWNRVRHGLGAYLDGLRHAGVLAGSTPEEAFNVKCDAELNPPEVRASGQLVIEVGVAVVNPAELAVFRVRQSVRQQGG